MRVVLYLLTAWIVLSIPVALVIGRVCGLYTKSSELLEPLSPSTRLPARRPPAVSSLQAVPCEGGESSLAAVYGWPTGERILSSRQ